VAIRTLSRIRVEQILDWISVNVSRQITLAELGAALRMSTSTAQRALRSVQLDFRRAVSDTRLSKAAKMLREAPDEKAEVLSLAAGWKSRKGLYAVVRRTHRCSLAKWRVDVLTTSLTNNHLLHRNELNVEN